MNERRFLRELGRKLRAERALRGLSQQSLAQAAQLSPRYLSQLEAGRGNVSILRLNDISRALGVPLHELVRVKREDPIVSLIGLRGAGKSTIGPHLAGEMQCPFIELDALVEEEAGLSLDDLFALHGERYYRRLERDVLVRAISAKRSFILATGGGLVTERATFDLLKGNTVTVWLHARPELHLARVIAQGDRRPMAGRSDPLSEIHALLREREPLYREADFALDTSELLPDAAAREIARELRRTEVRTESATI
ncbi:MAG TPA: shikimate kinase [Vicinamibacteria bacterium]|nr:shikimate kinase [Vicinamibacteria bacterium]